MKNLFPLIVLCLLSSCLSPRVNTEKFIKTTIEQHTPNNYSEILTNTFYKGSVKGGYLELVGCKYDTSYYFVISSDKSFIKDFSNNITSYGENLTTTWYTVLTKEDCIKIFESSNKLNNSRSINVNEGEQNTGGIDKTHYFDYTVSENFFISLEHKNLKKQNIINLWLYGEKYSLESSLFFKELSSFINWTKN